MQTYQDHSVVVLRGTPSGPRATSVVRKAQFTNTQNSAAIESRIDDGKITVPGKIPHGVSELIKTGRAKTDGCKTQALLAMKCSLAANDIAEMENGAMVLTHKNILKIRKVQTVLALQKFNL